MTRDNLKRIGLISLGIVALSGAVFIAYSLVKRELVHEYSEEVPGQMYWEKYFDTPIKDVHDFKGIVMVGPGKGHNGDMYFLYDGDLKLKNRDQYKKVDPASAVKQFSLVPTKDSPLLKEKKNLVCLYRKLEDPNAEPFSGEYLIHHTKSNTYFFTTAHIFWGRHNQSLQPTVPR